jgi:SPP1 family phage portal protein
MLKPAEIKRLIDEDAVSMRKRYARIGQRYYEGDHDIKEYRMFYYNADGELVEDRTRSNERISHPFFTELVDQLTAYILSSSDNPIQAVETAEGLQEQLDEYFDDDFWAEVSELISGAYIKGFDYLYAYINENDRLSFECADGMGVVEVREKDTDSGCECYIYSYIDRINKQNQPITRIQVHTDTEIYYYVQSGANGEITIDDEKPLNPQPNIVYIDTKTGQKYGAGLGFMPFFRLDYNRKQVSGIKPIKALIDDYDLMECGLSNNLQDFDKPIHVVKGFEGNDMDELIQNIKTKKAIGVGESGGLDIMTVNVPYEARKTKVDEDEKNIYRFGMGLNTLGLKDTTATTNLSIKMAYTLLDLKAEKFEKRIKKFLCKIIRIVLNEINKKNGTDYQNKDVKIEFTHEMIVNEQENAQNCKIKAETKQIDINTLLSAAAYIGDDDTLKSICDILELNYDEIKAKQPKEDDLNNVKADLDAIIPEGDVIE